MTITCVELYLHKVKVLYKGSVTSIYIKRESSEKKEKNPGSQRLGMVQGVDYKGTEWGNIWGDGAVLYYDCGGGYTTIHICQNLYNCIPQGVNFTICFKNMNKIKQN